QHFGVRLDGRHGHPVEGKQQHEKENGQRYVDDHPSARQCLQIVHPLLVEALVLYFHQSSPRCQARRCRPKYENMMAASRKGIIMMASAAPSPREPPGMARWNDNVVIKWVAFNGPPRVST